MKTRKRKECGRRFTLSTFVVAATTVTGINTMANALETTTSSSIQTRKTDKDSTIPTKLSICRNIHLSEKTFKAPSLPGPPPYNSLHVSETFALGGSGGEGGSSSPSSSGSDDTDVSFFLDSTGTQPTNFLADNVQFKIQFYTNHDEVKLLSIDYTEAILDLGGNGKSNQAAGIRLGDSAFQQSIENFYSSEKNENTGLELLHHEVTKDKFHSYTFQYIPHSSYVNTDHASWTDMRHIGITYGLESSSSAKVENVEVKIKLIQLCQDLDQPYFCAEETLDEYKEHCHDCHCETCHDCGCSEKLPWEHCSAHGKCDHDGCWCHPACVCCSDCDGHPCNCQECCDTTSLEGCSLGSTYEILSIEPADGMDGTEIDVIIQGKGFYGNAQNIICQFGEKDEAGDGNMVQVSGHYRSATELFCTIPPQTLPSGVTKLMVPVSISLDGTQFTSTSPQVNFTYYNCPHGCSDMSENFNPTSSTCRASVCQCPAHFYGPNCTLQCTDCVHGNCLSNSGSCVCDFGYTGDRCDVECPGGPGNPCSRRGSCFITTDLDENENTTDTVEAEAVCYCSPGYWGDSCEFECPKDDQGAVCSGRGTCDANTGECLCNAGYYRSNCGSASPGLSDAPNDGQEKNVVCGGNGVCCTGTGVSSMYSQCDKMTIGGCACDAGWSGDTCKEPSCFEDCYGHGACAPNGTCVCAKGYDGKFCSLQKGQDSSLSYFTFLESSHMVAEQVGFVSVDVERLGKISEEVSVMYETEDLTAEAGEDYVAASGRLHWSSMDASARTINVTIAKNDWPEGEESFEIVLKYPEPVDLASLGSTPVIIVRISAKPEIVEGGLYVARITLRVLKSWDDVKPGEKNGEELKAVFRDATLSATNIDSDQFYLQSIVPTDNEKVFLTFDILPLQGDTNAEDNIRKAANTFVAAVGNISSAMYESFDLTQKCPIDISFKPEIHMVSFDSEGHVKSSNGGAVGLFIFLSLLIAVAAIAYVKREPLQDWLFQSLVVRKFQSLRGSPDHDVVFEEGDFGDSNEVNRGGGFSEFAVTRIRQNSPDDGGGGLLFDGLKKKVLQIELT